MNTKFNRLMRDERGITALETAIILIAFVVVAAIFAFTVLSTGTFLTERSKEAAYAGLQEVRGSMELKGSVVANSANASTVDSVELTVAPVAGGASVDLSDTSATAKIQVTYHDKNTNAILDPVHGSTTTTVNGNWQVSKCSGCTGSSFTILGQGALATIKVYPPSGSLTGLAAYANFSLEIKPPTGGVLLIARTLPAQITQVTDLH